MAHNGLGTQTLKVNSSETGRGSGEAPIDDFLADSGGFEDLGGLVAEQSTDTNLGHNLTDTGIERVDVVVHEGLVTHFLVGEDLLAIPQAEHGEHGRTSVLDLLHLGGDGGEKTCTASGWGLARQGRSRASATRKEVLASPPTHVHRACTETKNSHGRDLHSERML